MFGVEQFRRRARIVAPADKEAIRFPAFYRFPTTQRCWAAAPASPAIFVILLIHNKTRTRQDTQSGS